MLTVKVAAVCNGVNDLAFLRVACWPFSSSGFWFQAEGRDGRPGGESAAAAVGDHAGDAGGSAGGEAGAGEEEPGRLGRYTDVAPHGDTI